jgi:hypothetical protein
MAKQTIPVTNAQAKHQPKPACRAWVRFLTGRNVGGMTRAGCSADEAETEWLGRFQIVSPGRLCLLLNRRFEPGTALIIELSDKPDLVVRFFQVRVIHSRRKRNRRWLIDCEFLSPPTPEELQALLGP